MVQNRLEVVTWNISVKRGNGCGICTRSHR